MPVETSYLPGNHVPGGPGPSHDLRLDHTHSHSPITSGAIDEPWRSWWHGSWAAARQAIRAALGDLDHAQRAQGVQAKCGRSKPFGEASTGGPG